VFELQSRNLLKLHQVQTLPVVTCLLSLNMNFFMFKVVSSPKATSPISKATLKKLHAVASAQAQSVFDHIHMFRNAISFLAPEQKVEKDVLKGCVGTFQCLPAIFFAQNQQNCQVKLQRTKQAKKAKRFPKQMMNLKMSS
jgi:hypothetical protein